MTVAHGDKHRLKPNRLERHMASNDPDVEMKAADTFGLHLNLPAGPAVFQADGKTGIQALDRKYPMLPPSPGRAERHGFEYGRHGTLALYAALNTRPGEVRGKTAARHTWPYLVAFRSDIVAHQPAGKQTYVISDNLKEHKTKRVEEFSAADPSDHLHSTPN